MEFTAPFYFILFSFDNRRNFLTNHFLSCRRIYFLYKNYFPHFINTFEEVGEVIPKTSSAIK